MNRNQLQGRERIVCLTEERRHVKAGTRSRPFQTGRIYEIKSAKIRQPSPAALTARLSQCRRFIRRWSEETEP